MAPPTGLSVTRITGYSGIRGCKWAIVYRDWWGGNITVILLLSRVLKSLPRELQSTAEMMNLTIRLLFIRDARETGCLMLQRSSGRSGLPIHLVLRLHIHTLADLMVLTNAYKRSRQIFWKNAESRLAQKPRSKEPDKNSRETTDPFSSLRIHR